MLAELRYISKFKQKKEIEQNEYERNKIDVLSLAQPGPQYNFLATEADVAFYGGAAGGGKTFALLLEELKDVHNPKFRGVIFRRNSVQVRNPGGLWHESMAIYKKYKGHPREAYLEWIFPSKATLKFAHLEHEKSIYDWQGSQVPFIGFDEVTHFTEMQFTYMFSRNRSTSGVKPRVRATCNPDVNSWVRQWIDWYIDANGFAIPERSGEIRWFVRKDGVIYWENSRKEIFEKFGEESQPKSFTFISAKVTDNKILMEKDPAYIANLQALSRVERERLLGANWNVRVVAGSYFQEQWFELIDTLPGGWIKSVRYWDRACLITGTMIITDTGTRPIEDIKIGEKVLTRSGFKSVKWSGISKKTNEIFSIIFSNGSVVTGTREHPVWTKNRGWINLSNLVADDIVCTVKKDISIAMNGTKKINDMITDHCTETYMNFTTEAFPMACISTIKTETGLITKSEIWNVFPEKITDSIIKTILHMRLILKIRHTEKKHLKLFKKRLNKKKNTNVFHVVKNIFQKVLNRNIAKNYAEKNLEKELPVYDLTVEDCPEFFANNILVHNSTQPNEENKDPDWTRGLRMLKYPNGICIVADLRSIRGSPLEVEKLIVNTASWDGHDTIIYGEEDPGSAGKSDIGNFTRMLAGYYVQTVRNTKDKETRAKAVSAQSEAGNIKILRAPWNKEFFSELENFPLGAHDDIVDVYSGAFNVLCEGFSLLNVL